MRQTNNQLNRKIFFLNLFAVFFVGIFLFIVIVLLNHKVASPYPLHENIYWVYKNIFGLSYFNPKNINTLDPVHVVDPDIKTEYTVVFAGDMLPLYGRPIRFSYPVKQFINSSDAFVGNFEGVITTKANPQTFWNVDLKQSRGSLNLFRKFTAPKKVYLSVANNHAFDFGKREFDLSNDLLRDSGVQVFGTEGKPYVDLNPFIRVIAATQWMNKENQGVLWAEEAHHYIHPDKFNILYPQFGYEFELYPRAKTVEKVAQWLHSFDAVIGHHPHCPQPVTFSHQAGKSKLVAYSLGTFFADAVTEKYQYGILLKLFLGKNPSGEMALSKIEYRLIRNSVLLNGDYLVDFSPSAIGAFQPFRPNQYIQNDMTKEN
jgi:hypothetical protein